MFMKTSESFLKRFLILIFTTIILVVTIYTFNYIFIYKSINVVTTKTNIIEYGSSNTDVSQFVDKVDGKILSVKNKLESRVVGKQEIVLVVAKGVVSKEIPISVEVKDTTSPTINLLSDVVTVEQGEEFDLVSNIESVVDSVDGVLSYVLDPIENSNNYYTINSDINFNVVGSYDVNIYAIDKNNNSSTSNFTVVVEKREISDRLVNMAYSQLGKPYSLGANGPYAFDCSGFVQYLYRQVGINISRGSSTQMFDGEAVSYDNILPGDIISWGYSDDFATHSALYVGNGKMIHAANPSKGVILSDVSSWARGSFTKIISVRRIK